MIVPLLACNVSQVRSLPGSATTSSSSSAGGGGAYLDAHATGVVAVEHMLRQWVPLARDTQHYAEGKVRERHQVSFVHLDNSCALPACAEGCARCLTRGCSLLSVMSSPTP